MEHSFDSGVCSFDFSDILLPKGCEAGRRDYLLMRVTLEWTMRQKVVVLKHSANFHLGSNQDLIS